jgi:hypothetical protein
VTELRVNTEDVYKRARKMVEDFTEKVRILSIQREEVMNLNDNNNYYYFTFLFMVYTIGYKDSSTHAEC